MVPVRDDDDTGSVPHPREMAMADRDEQTESDRHGRGGKGSDLEGRTAPGIEPATEDVAVIPDADDLEDRYRLLRELRGLGRCVGLEG
jgi:hypothetical protein